MPRLVLANVVRVGVGASLTIQELLAGNKAKSCELGAGARGPAKHGRGKHRENPGLVEGHVLPSAQGRPLLCLVKAQRAMLGSSHPKIQHGCNSNRTAL